MTRCPNLFGAPCTYAEMRNGLLICTYDPKRPVMITDDCPRLAHVRSGPIRNKANDKDDKDLHHLR